MPATRHRELADRYLLLGGRRQSKIDDNIASTRHWKGDPPEAERFWQSEIETLSAEDLKQVVLFLHDINQS